MDIKDLFKLITGRLLKLLLFFFLGFLAHSSAFAQDPSFPFKFNHLTVDEGLSHTDANDIVQDKHGFIWVATYFGISRYDGYSIKRYYNENVPANNAFKNRVRSITADEEGRIWLGTEDGLQCFNPRTEKYLDFPKLQKYVTPPFSKLLRPDGNLLYGLTGGILKMYSVEGENVREEAVKIPIGVEFSDLVSNKNGILYLSSNKGLWSLGKDKKFTFIPVTGLTDLNLSRLYFDKQLNLLIATEKKLMLLTKPLQNTPLQKLAVSKSYQVPEDIRIRDIMEGGGGDYWLNGSSGLLRLSHNLQFIQRLDNRSTEQSLTSKSLGRCIVDRSECLWVCSFGGGVSYCDLNQKLFYTIKNNPGIPNSLSGNHVRSLLEDGDKLWIGTTANGLNQYDLKTKKYTYYNTYNSPVRLKHDEIASLTLDNDFNLWIGNGQGIEILKRGGRELWKPAGYEHFPKYVIETLVKDCYGNIWFGNHMNNFGVIWKDASNTYNVRYYDEGYFIQADSKTPQLFISSTKGLKRVIIDNRGNILKTFHYKASSKPNSLTSDYTYPVCKQNDSIYWVGTIGGGLNKLALNLKTNAFTITPYTDRYGVFKDVESMEIDNAGNVWMGGNGLERLDPKTGKLIRYDKNDGLQGNSFKVGSSYKGASGRLYFGGISGLNYFYPEQIKSSRVAAYPVLTDILINNQKPEYGEQKSSRNIIAEAISYTKELRLSYLQNNFLISFSAMNYANPLKCKYRYKLLGFDKEWRFTDGTNAKAAYSNLDYKTYRFIVQATNIDGIWSANEAHLDITITPPWWKSTLAKILYSLLILSGLAGVYIYQARWYRLKREIEVRAINERKRNEMHQQRTELYQQQLQFFTNISHEFRTPLTLILGPLENLMSQNNNPALSNSYQLMLRNTRRLMNLVSELMNFKKAADDIIKLQVQPLAISQFCKELITDFQDLSEGKDISFKLIDHTGASNEELTNYFDVQILEKILLNLLNNGFKYTEPGGEVSLEIFFNLEEFKPSFQHEFQLLNKDFRSQKYLYFGVSDTGIGISGESIHKIFDRYYRVSKDHLGSGVGLALVRSLTQIHKGNIYVYSERYKGTEIIIGLPWGEENYAEAEKVAPGTEFEPKLEEVDNSILLPLRLAGIDTDEDVKHVKRILLVDDNSELRSFLKESFEKHYLIYEAADGKEALEIAAEKMPDLIISDVMMPVMDGIEFCKRVKEQFETSHIPFIILSAKDTLDSKLEGMGSGADYYFGKPLSMELLQLTVQNIFEQSEKLKQRYTSDYLVEVTELVHNEKDKEFLQKLLDVIEENIQDPNLDVDFLCQHLYISRTKLYQKIKSVSDQSVGEFIRTIRLKKAIQIMTHEDVTMNEVVDRIGLQSSSNFSRAFKKEYGKSPLQYIKSLKK
ncbi:hybrid sensor histidine kinase/response regulator transcription factor [Desertivirga arenae]|uniref:hybrid sensor histidine kinase/response regulator transcription factor n=1 Tax=Desertivirga arenae TaxID=2810309 RepID=UPI001A9710C0|nr:response regulator [Pedobacter sp. SYSU D00823]